MGSLHESAGVERLKSRAQKSFKVKIQDQGVPLTTNEVSNQELDNNSDLLKNHHDQNISLQVGIQGNGFKVTQLSGKSSMVGVDVSIKQESLVGTQMSTEREKNQENDYKNNVLEP